MESDDAHGAHAQKPRILGSWGKTPFVCRVFKNSIKCSTLISF